MMALHNGGNSIMKISTEIESFAKLIGEERVIEYAAKAGFDAWDFTMRGMCPYDPRTRSAAHSDHPLAGADYLKYARKLRQIGLDNGIVCNQSHAPYPVRVPEIRAMLKRAIECTAEAGGEICIIHPDNNKSPEENAEMYFELLPFAKDCGVKIAAENMWNWDRENNCSSFAACATSESFNAHLDAVGDDYLVACLDIGHAEMYPSGSGAANMIRALAPRLAALHIHDNDKRNDSHRMPFTMDINFSEVVAALRDIGYSGYFTLEADQHYNDYTAETAFEGIKLLAESARRLADMFAAK